MVLTKLELKMQVDSTVLVTFITVRGIVRVQVGDVEMQIEGRRDYSLCCF